MGKVVMVVVIPALIMLASFTLSSAKSSFSFSTTTTTTTTTSLGVGGVIKEEKLTALRFYLSDIGGGLNRTIVPLTTILDNSTFYGGLFMADDPLTLTPELNSTLVGRGRGHYGFPSPTDNVFEMVYTLAFTLGEYNRSTLSIMGSIYPLSTVNELSVVGGTGLFRFARGYAIVTTTLYHPQADQLVIREFDVRVSH